MKGYFAVAAFILAAFYSFQTGSGIKCYVCNSHYDPGCGDWFDNSTYPLTRCADKDTMCRKTVQETWSADKWDVRVVRLCASEGKVGADDGRQCLERTGTYRVKMKFCQCNQKDGCNGAGNIALNGFTILASLFFAVGVIYKSS